VAAKYRRWHGTLEAAEAEVERVYRQYPDSPRFEITNGDGRIVASTLIKAMK
jgi:hypothetical protein